MRWEFPRELLWAIILGLAIFVVALWPSHYPYSQASNINSQQKSVEGVSGGNSAQHSPARLENFPSNENKENGGKHTQDTEIWGVKRGEWLLFLATIGLWFATWRLVRGADATAKHQLRAYISVEPVTLYNFGEGLIPSADFSIKNVGQTPAYRVRHIAMVDVLEHPLLPNQGELLLPDPDAIIPSRSLQPTLSIVGGADMERRLTAQDIARVIEGIDYQIYLFGTVIYIDAFKIERKTKFCCHVGGRDFAHAVQLAKSQKSTEVKMLWDFAVLHNEAT